MKISILALLLVLVAVNSLPAPGYTTTTSMTWANWCSPYWQPTWAYNTSWTKPAPPSNYHKRLMSANDPTRSYRSYHYIYDSNDLIGTSLYCGPQSYLSPNYRCWRDPFYWDITKLKETCVPDVEYNGVRIPCTNTDTTT